MAETFTVCSVGATTVTCAPMGAMPRPSPWLGGGSTAFCTFSTRVSEAGSQSAPRTDSFTVPPPFQVGYTCTLPTPSRPPTYCLYAAILPPKGRSFRASTIRSRNDSSVSVSSPGTRMSVIWALVRPGMAVMGRIGPVYSLPMVPAVSAVSW